MGQQQDQVGQSNRTSTPLANSWSLDPFDEIGGGQITIDRVAIIRIVSVAVEAGARMQREALAVDALEWIISPLELFCGRPPIRPVAKAGPV